MFKLKDLEIQKIVEWVSMCSSMVEKYEWEIFPPRVDVFTGSRLPLIAFPRL
jgi:hypothetical protein